MAYKARITDQMVKSSPNLKRVPHLYQIERAVGSNCPNIREDVLLIQFMLNRFLYTSPLTGGKVAGNSIWGDVPLNGTCDFPTLGFLIMFQLFNSQNGPSTGRIEPMNLNALQLQGGFLALLNGHILTNEPQVFNDFSVAPGIPSALIPFLRTPK